MRKFFLALVLVLSGLCVSIGVSASITINQALVSPAGDHIVVIGDTIIGVQNAGGITINKVVDGNVVLSTTFAGGSNEYPMDVVVDHTGRYVYVPGVFVQDIQIGPTTLSSSGGLNDAFLAKVRISDLSVIWVRQGLASQYAYTTARGAAVDPTTGNVTYYGFAFGGNASFEGQTLVNAGSADVFVVTYDSSGVFQGLDSYGSYAWDDVTDGVFDQNGVLHLFGYFRYDVNFFGTTHSAGGAPDYPQSGYIASVSGGSLVGFRKIQATGSNAVLSILGDVCGNNLYFAVNYNQQVQTPLGTTLGSGGDGTRDASFGHFDASGSGGEWTVELASGPLSGSHANGFTKISDCACDPVNGDVYVVGKMEKTSIVPDATNFASVDLGGGDYLHVKRDAGFVTRFDSTGNLSCYLQNDTSSTATVELKGVTVLASGDVALTGIINGPEADFLGTTIEGNTNNNGIYLDVDLDCSVPRPDPVFALVVGHVDTNSVELSFRHNGLGLTMVTETKVFRYRDNGELLLLSEDTSVVITGLSSNYNYRWEVVVKDTATGLQSDPVSGEDFVTPCRKPKVSVIVTENRAELQFASVDSANGFWWSARFGDEDPVGGMPTVFDPTGLIIGFGEDTVYWEAQSDCSADSDLVFGSFSYKAPVSVGIDPLHKEILVYPNPSNGLFTLVADQELLTKGYEVFDIAGHLVLEGASTSISLTRFEAGHYFLRFKTGEHLRLVKK